MGRLYALFLLLCTLAASYAHIIKSTDNACPSSELIKPCTCSQNEDGTVVYCIGLTSHVVLETVFRNIPSWSFSQLNIYDSSMLYIPSSIFKNSSFSAIELKGSTLVSLFNEPPTSKSLQHIYIKTSDFLRGMQWDLLSKLDLEEILIEKTGVRKLVKSFGEGVPKSLKYFGVQDTNLTRLNHNALVDLVNLEGIIINYGVLKKLDEMLFPKSIKMIEFSYNKIESLPDGLFKDLPNLKLVMLANNVITTVQQEVFKNIPVILLGGNPINCNCELKWLVTTGKNDDIYSSTCASPDNLKGKDLQELTTSDFSYCGK